LQAELGRNEQKKNDGAGEEEKEKRSIQNANGKIVPERMFFCLNF
jgi:hypothetical protein